MSRPNPYDDAGYIEGLAVAMVLATPTVIADFDMSHEEFVDERLKAVWFAIQALDADRKLLDISSVSARIEEQTGTSGWFDFLRGVLSQHVEYARMSKPGTAERISKEHKNRSIIERATTLISSFNARSVDDVDALVSELMKVTSDADDIEVKPIASSGLKAMIDAAQEAAECVDYENGLVGVDTGITELNNFTKGYRGGKLYLLGGMPGDGKTSLLLKSISVNHDVPSLFISLEMPEAELVQRLAQIQYRVPSSVFDGKVDDYSAPRLSVAVSGLRSSLVDVTDRGGLSITQIERLARRAKREKGIKILFVDYVQLIENHGYRERREAISDVSLRLKNLAKELDIPVVCAAQVNRDSAKGKPRQYHLAESAGLERNSDMIAMIWHGHPDADKLFPDGSKLSMLVVDKHRGGRTGDIATKWTPQYVTFGDLVPGEHLVGRDKGDKDDGSAF